MNNPLPPGGLVPPLHFRQVELTTAETQHLDAQRLQVPGLGLLPVQSHPGAFGTARRFHCHEGVDLYAPPGAQVRAVAAGEVLCITPFTGEQAGSPWWEDTWCVLVRHLFQNQSFCLNYGEIQVQPGLAVGQHLIAGQVLGSVTQVLKKDKGRPMTMLHLERYSPDVQIPLKEWPLGALKPEVLHDPTDLLRSIYLSKEARRES